MLKRKNMDAGRWQGKSACNSLGQCPPCGLMTGVQLRCITTWNSAGSKTLHLPRTQRISASKRRRVLSQYKMGWNENLKKGIICGKPLLKCINGRAIRFGGQSCADRGI